MKISNYKLTQCIAYLLIVIILLSVFLILFLHYLFTDILFATLSIISLLALMRLQCIIYENSGNCITFRKHHPFTFRKFIPPFIELPESSIKDFNCNKNLGGTKLTLKLNSTRKKNRVLKMFLLGFTNSQRQKITSSLQMIRLNNHNDNQLF